MDDVRIVPKTLRQFVNLVVGEHEPFSAQVAVPAGQGAQEERRKNVVGIRTAHVTAQHKQFPRGEMEPPSQADEPGNQGLGFT